MYYEHTILIQNLTINATKINIQIMLNKVSHFDVLAVFF